MKSPRIYLLTLLFAATPMLGLATSESDGQIEDAAKATYNYRTVLKDDVQVDVEDGVVTLTGTVEDKSVKTLAGDTMKGIPGVVQVRNHIEVEPQPVEHSDAWITLKVRMALLMHSDVSIAKTDVAVEKGVVTLHGMVDNVAQEELTMDYVRKIEGVRDIINRMTVKKVPDSDRPMSVVIDDASITARVNYELLKHRSTSALGTNITTKLGIVMIEGEAENSAEKSLVTQLAKGVSGVKSVDNQMTIKGDGEE